METLDQGPVMETLQPQGDAVTHAEQLGRCYLRVIKRLLRLEINEFSLLTGDMGEALAPLFTWISKSDSLGS